MASDFDVILMVGPQGSGKGTQGKRLAQKLGFFYWEMGVILRELLKENTPLAEKVSVINNGTLLSDELLIEVIQDRLQTIPRDKGIIFDGVPRRIGQAEFLLRQMEAQGRGKAVTLYISLSREESVKRLLLRGKTEGRVDDTPEAIDRRLQAFEEAGKPMLEYLKEKTRFIEIDGGPSIDEVEKAIDAELCV